MGITNDVSAVHNERSNNGGSLGIGTRGKPGQRVEFVCYFVRDILFGLHLVNRSVRVAQEEASHWFMRSGWRTTHFISIVNLTNRAEDGVQSSAPSGWPPEPKVKRLVPSEIWVRERAGGLVSSASPGSTKP